jgi:hypothetical protein
LNAHLASAEEYAAAVTTAIEELVAIGLALDDIESYSMVY